MKLAYLKIDGVYIYINKTLDKVETIEGNTDNIGINTETKEEFKEIKNIALLGIDSRDDDLVGRSDSIMILTLDSVHNKIKLSSIISKWVKVDPLSPPGVSESKFANRRGIFMIFFKKSSLNWGVSEFCIQINDDSFYSYRHFGLIKNNNRI